MKLFLITFLFLISICYGQQNASHIIYGLFTDDNDNTTFIYYGSFNVDTKQFNIISKLNINDVGNPRKETDSFLPLTYDPNTDVIYISALNNQNQTLLSVINATTGSLLRTFDPIENYIISLQFDIFEKQLFAHIEIDQKQISQIVEIDTMTGKFKQILGTIRQAIPTYISSYCPICKKYFLMAGREGHAIYIGVNSSNGGGISWETPIDIIPVSMHFDYKTFTMYVVYYKDSESGVFRLGILNRTLGGIGKEIKILAQSGNIAAWSISAYDISENIFYSLLISVWPPQLGISYVNVNTSNGNDIWLPRDSYSPYAWFIKQFVH